MASSHLPRLSFSPVWECVRLYNSVARLCRFCVCSGSDVGNIGCGHIPLALFSASKYAYEVDLWFKNNSLAEGPPLQVIDSKRFFLIILLN